MKSVLSDALTAAKITFTEIRPKIALYARKIPLEFSTDQLLGEARKIEPRADGRVFLTKEGWTSNSGKILLEPAVWRESVSDLKICISQSQVYRLFVTGFPPIFISMWEDRRGSQSQKSREKAMDTTPICGLSQNKTNQKDQTYAEKVNRHRNPRNAKVELKELIAQMKAQQRKIDEQNKSFLCLQESVLSLGGIMAHSVNQSESIISQVHSLHTKVDQICQFLNVQQKVSVTSQPQSQKISHPVSQNLIQEKTLPISPPITAHRRQTNASQLSITSRSRSRYISSLVESQDLVKGVSGSTIQKNET